MSRWEFLRLCWVAAFNSAWAWFGGVSALVGVLLPAAVFFAKRVPDERRGSLVRFLSAPSTPEYVWFLPLIVTFIVLVVRLLIFAPYGIVKAEEKKRLQAEVALDRASSDASKWRDRVLANPPGGPGGFAVVDSSDVHITSTVTVNAERTGPKISATVVRGEVINLAALAADGVMALEDKVFERCRFVGPAVIAPVDVTFGRNTFLPPEADYPPGSEVLAIVPSIHEMSYRVVVGAIAVNRVKFDLCTFENVALAVPQDEAATVRAAFRAAYDRASKSPQR